MTNSLRWTTLMAFVLAILAAACDPKDRVKGDDGDRGETGETGPAGPPGPPGSADAWSLTGNAGTVPGTSFLGTTDDVPFEIWVNSARVMRLEPEKGTLIFGANFICGASTNTVTPGATGCTVLGGTNAPGFSYESSATDDYCTVAGGFFNRAGNGGTVGDANSATVGGGSSNVADGGESTVAGGSGNRASGLAAFVGGGRNNEAAYEATVGGGEANTASGDRTFIGGGIGNTAASDYSAIPGGVGNVARGDGSMIPGGIENETHALCALAAGRHARTRFDGSFVWADVAAAAGIEADPFRSDVRANQFNAFASGGVRFVTRYDLEGLPVASAELAPGGSSWLSLLDRASVADLRKVDPRDILARLRTLPVSTWSFAAQDPSVRHLGPLAEDFRAAFGLGESDRHIGHLDADGIALAAIQGLAQEVEDRDARIASVERDAREREAWTLRALAEKQTRIDALEEKDARSERRISELEVRLARLERLLEVK